MTLEKLVTLTEEFEEYQAILLAKHEEVKNLVKHLNYYASKIYIPTHLTAVAGNMYGKNIKSSERLRRKWQELLTYDNTKPGDELKWDKLKYSWQRETPAEGIYTDVAVLFLMIIERKSFNMNVEDRGYTGSILNRLLNHIKDIPNYHNRLPYPSLSVDYYTDHIQVAKDAIEDLDVLVKMLRELLEQVEDKTA